LRRRKRNKIEKETKSSIFRATQDRLIIREQMAVTSIPLSITV